MYHVIGGAQNRTFRVIWMLEELGERYERTACHPQEAVVRQHSVLGKLPVLLVDDVPLTDSTAILTFLADRHGRFTAPPGTLARAAQDGITHQVLDELEAGLWLIARHVFILPEERRIPQVREVARWELEQRFEMLARRLKGPYLMGESLSVPDFIALHCINWAIIAKVPLPEALGDYAEMLRQRPGYQRAVAADKAAEAQLQAV